MGLQSHENVVRVGPRITNSIMSTINFCCIFMLLMITIQLQSKQSNDHFYFWCLFVASSYTAMYPWRSKSSFLSFRSSLDEQYDLFISHLPSLLFIPFLFSPTFKKHKGVPTEPSVPSPTKMHIIIYYLLLSTTSVFALFSDLPEDLYPLIASHLPWHSYSSFMRTTRNIYTLTRFSSAYLEAEVHYEAARYLTDKTEHLAAIEKYGGVIRNFNLEFHREYEEVMERAEDCAERMKKILQLMPNLITLKYPKDCYAADSFTADFDLTHLQHLQSLAILEQEDATINLLKLPKKLKRLEIRLAIVDWTKTNIRDLAELTVLHIDTMQDSESHTLDLSPFEALETLTLQSLQNWDTNKVLSRFLPENLVSFGIGVYTWPTTINDETLAGMQLHRLKKLRVLHLASCRLKGSEPHINRIKSLEELFFYDRHMHPKDLNNLRLQELPKLHSLKIIAYQQPGLEFLINPLPSVKYLELISLLEEEVMTSEHNFTNAINTLNTRFQSWTFYQGFHR